MLVSECFVADHMEGVRVAVCGEQLWWANVKE